MFTGLVEEIGDVLSVQRRYGSMRITVAVRTILESMQEGDSVNIDGVCHTVTSFSDADFTVDTLAETLKKTTLGTYKPGRRVNLERSLTLERRMGGHFVQGHVNDTGLITTIRREQNNVFVTVELSDELMKYCIREGSLALDGISLTIAEISGREVTINVIPHTYSHTTLQSKKTGDRVNVEVDLLGRYVERLLGLARPTGLTEEKLKSLGW